MSASHGPLQAGDEVLWVRLRVVEDDEQSGLPHGVHDAVVAHRDARVLSERRRSHVVLSLDEVSRQDSGYEDELVSVGVGGRVGVGERVGGFHSEVHALSERRGCVERKTKQTEYLYLCDGFKRLESVSRSQTALFVCQRTREPGRVGVLPFLPQKLLLKPWMQISFTLLSLVPW